MKVYDSVGPNPKVVQMFIKENGIELACQTVDLMGGENRQEAYMKINPTGTLPALELDDGSVISETTAICEYLAEKEGGSSLIGETPEERAETRMWVRRIDLGITENMANGFRFSDGMALFKARMPTFPEAASGLKQIAQGKLTWLDEQLADKEFVCGSRFSLADILLFCFLEFGGHVGQPLDEKNKNLSAWYDRVQSRASAGTSPS